MDRPLKILTFNWHEPYICLLARTGHDFSVVAPRTNSGKIRDWDERMRPIPANVTVISVEKAQEALAVKSYELAICNNIQDVLFIKETPLPFIKVFHNKFSTEAGLSKNPPDLEEYKRSLEELTSKGLRIFISQTKKSDWGLEGAIITPGIDTADYPEYTGDVAQALVVGNLVKERDLMMGYRDQVELLEGLPNFLMGLNPTIPGSRISEGWEDLKEHFKRLRLYLNTTVEGREDGYNLAMLEAMATGMPVVSTFNSTSPIIDGVNGFISKDKEYLKSKIRELLQNPDLAKRIGKEGRKTILEKFNINDFAEKWNNAITECLELAAQRKIKELSETFSALKKAEKYEEIIQEFQKSADVPSGKAGEEIYLTAADSYAITGNFPKAKELYQQCLSTNPGCCGAYVGLGTLSLQEQNADAAYDLLQRALEIDENNSKALCGVGITLLMQGFMPESKGYFLKSLDSDMNNLLALNQLITVSHSLQDYRDAITSLEKYLSLHMTALDYSYTLASLLFVTGERERSRAEVEKILLFEPENASALELLSKIEAEA